MHFLSKSLWKQVLLVMKPPFFTPLCCSGGRRGQRPVKGRRGLGLGSERGFGCPGGDGSCFGIPRSCPCWSETGAEISPSPPWLPWFLARTRCLACPALPPAPAGWGSVVVLNQGEGRFYLEIITLISCLPSKLPVLQAASKVTQCWPCLKIHPTRHHGDQVNPFWGAGNHPKT